MKKIAFILFLFFHLSAVSQLEYLISYPVLSFKIDPIMLAWEKGGGGIFEYRFKENLSVELGGEVNKLGYTARTGVRYYLNFKDNTYFSFHFFYRNWNYKNRTYQWNRDTPLSPIIETSYLITFSGTDCWFRDTADEHKQVFSGQILYGQQFLLTNRILFDWYVGLGLRYKYRVKEIFYHGGGRCYSPIYYLPPKEEIVKTFLPSIQLGIVIGFSFKNKQMAE